MNCDDWCCDASKEKDVYRTTSNYHDDSAGKRVAPSVLFWLLTQLIAK